MKKAVRDAFSYTLAILLLTVLMMFALDGVLFHALFVRDKKRMSVNNIFAVARAMKPDTWQYNTNGTYTLLWYKRNLTVVVGKIEGEWTVLGQGHIRMPRYAAEKLEWIVLMGKLSWEDEKRRAKRLLDPPDKVYDPMTGEEIEVW